MGRTDYVYCQSCGKEIGRDEATYYQGYAFCNSVCVEGFDMILDSKKRKQEYFRFDEDTRL
ncbi:MAG: hypothetical protein GY863_20465 [bacterium]|nr:hypothetical protein [bacterium]